MFGASRANLEALQAIAKQLVCLNDGVQASRLDGDSKDILRERIEALELSRATWEAEMEAELLKADSRYKAASSAESRARTMEKAYQKFTDDFPPESTETPEELEERFWQERQLGLTDGEGGEVNGMQRVPVGLEAGSKGHAVRAKFS